jgi:hypothetical protein
MDEMRQDPPTRRPGKSRSSAKATPSRNKASKKIDRQGASSSASKARKPTTAKSSTGAKAAATPGVGPAITPEERQRRIEEAAYLIAERRGFAGGDAVEDWLRAELEVDAQLMETSNQPRRPKPRK